MKTKTEFQTVKEAYLEQLKEQQLNERRRSGPQHPLQTMTKRDLDKHMKAIDEIHAKIMFSMIDSVPEDFPIRKRETLEKRLNAAYSKYWDMLDQQIMNVLEK